MTTFSGRAWQGVIIFSEIELARECALCGREFGGHRGKDHACEDLQKPEGRMFYPNPPKTFFKAKVAC